MPRLAHISDLHFGRIDASAVAALERDLLAQAPDLVVVSGDLTQRGRHRQFREARAFLDRLARPVLVVPGNHDVPAWNLVSRFLRPYRRFTRHITPDLSPLVTTDTLAILGLNTARRAVRHWNWALGSINARQLAEAARLLGEHGDGGRLRVVVTHHPVVLPPFHRSGPMLFNADRALSAFAANQVDLMISGHLHRTHAAVISVPRVTAGGAGPSWAMVVVQAGSATSTRLRDEPNGYNLLDMSTTPPRIRVESRAWRPDGGFATTARSAFSRESGHWVPA
ncbi:metallophosphoesterase family protein [Roseospira visakhapatnamensis]|uniref:3',5'-cyclic AMP phosphodiesterase CpdA n=1 Tax=Roseospira visakhapatnamensis TaxID=390880 RepID=A0A7W6RBL4_9PROT|nr:metallophosphoesterase family protein [Roseospira visakhapatnamensis]MBB4265141.1 3',5'-cyclic AMP phosphodiesterase CpdA [Roseospira visakhapatnamensis]